MLRSTLTTLQLDDINRPFTFDVNTFDLVHSRLVGGGVNRTRWPNYVRDIKKCGSLYCAAMADLLSF